ncbi:hypothetical protein Poly24_06980 [Rosistilla carotiformis]|uniref:DUF1844 domain-containing protein n=1 Tax=Rosistilla carotiformis TaxID=2528017 RepID=A0A518JN97_9BACT|nr:DUF1844 domain-containing protein [Rosistilla carotiformis]QDV67007.1 hypothetical protein Poly24_06980 [Rosistilla carotiformis]
MSEENEEKEPKLIIDDDWKTQVQKEKEALAEKQAAAESTADDATPAASEEASSADDSQPSDDIEPPPASFEMLVAMLGSQALISLGKVPNPMTGKNEPNKAIAKHYIDTLAMLQEKTKRNLTGQEHDNLTQTLHQLRMLFVSM